MATIHRDKLNILYSWLPAGPPVSSEDLAALGISADLAVHYVRAGWLKRLARGVYRRPNDAVALKPSLIFLQRSLAGLHVGGKSALDWQGIRHYVSQHPALHLYGWQAGRLPGWFTERFPAEFHRKRLFDEDPDALLHVRPFQNRADAPLVSAPERALLEVLSEVGIRQPLQEARDLVESAYSLRAHVMRDLLKHCSSVKTVRLCLQLGRELSQPWAASSTGPNCPPAAINVGYRDRPMAFWYSSRESHLPGHRTAADARGTAGAGRRDLRVKRRHGTCPEGELANCLEMRGFWGVGGRW